MNWGLREWRSHLVSGALVMEFTLCGAATCARHVDPFINALRGAGNGAQGLLHSKLFH